MRIADVMSRGVCVCGANDSLNHAAQLMWEHDCGCLPVVDAEGKAIGMVTDRDICMAAYTQGEPLGRMLVSSAASHAIVAAHENDDVEAVEALMRKHQIRRVPVVDAAGHPLGIVSMNDLVRHAQAKGHRGGNSLNAQSVVWTLSAVGQPAAHATAAE